MRIFPFDGRVVKANKHACTYMHTCLPLYFRFLLMFFLAYYVSLTVYNTHLFRLMKTNLGLGAKLRITFCFGGRPCPSCAHLSVQWAHCESQQTCNFGILRFFGFYWILGRLWPFLIDLHWFLFDFEPFFSRFLMIFARFLLGFDPFSAVFQ